ncbi:coenzyme F420-dependent N5,N10-methylene tetrahydromethanopterin reductase [Achromobacter marplatensis]|nr:coenzyme F420-dependent N5,N10-methylene tetrahydromethanopterin reductase [Achromobacter marplatensis]
MLEETFALFVPSQSKLIVQYSHSGVRTPKMADYLSQATNAGAQGYRLHPMVNKSVLDLYRQKSEVAKMHIMVDKVSQADIDRFKGTKIEQMMKACVESNAKRFEATFSVEIGSKDQSLVGRLVGPISGRIRKRKHLGDKLLLEAREDAADRLHAIDLLAATESRSFNEAKVIRTKGKRYEATSMFHLLEVAMKEWV